MRRLEINLNKIKHNAKTLKEEFAKKGITITSVIKGVAGSPEIANAILESGINTIAVSQFQDIKKMKEFGVKAEFLLTRLPMHSEVPDIVKYADIGLNSEISTVRLLSEHSLKQGKRHKVVLMLELGDLREGILPQDIDSFVEQTIPLKGIKADVYKGFAPGLLNIYRLRVCILPDGAPRISYCFKGLIILL